MSTATSDQTMYRLAPPDRTGVLLGLSAGQAAVLGVGGLLSVVSITHTHLIRGLLLGTATLFVAFGRWKGQPAISLLPSLGLAIAARMRRRQQWYAALPMCAEGRSQPLDLPPAMRGQRILAVEGARFDLALLPAIAIVHDTYGHRVSATIRASGRRFGFLDPGERSDAVDAWGRVLVAWGRETTSVDHLRVTEWAAPAGLENHKAWVRDQLAADAVPAAIVAYEDLVDAARNMATPHETYLTLVVDIRKAAKFQGTKKSRSSKDARLELGIRVLLDEMRVLRQRLESVGLAVSAPLAPGELGRIMRHRFDAWATSSLDVRARTLGERLGTTMPEMAGPLATDTQWKHWRTDSTVHRAFAVTEWPRQNLPADWFGNVLLDGRHVVRAVSLFFEPIPPSRSRKAITWTHTKLETDEQHRIERKLRVPAALRTQKEAVRQREQELEQGHREFAYGGIIVVSSDDVEALEDASRDMTEVCANAGLAIRPLDGRHDTAMVATLPMARSVIPRAVYKDMVG